MNEHTLCANYGLHVKFLEFLVNAILFYDSKWLFSSKDRIIVCQAEFLLTGLLLKMFFA